MVVASIAAHNKVGSLRIWCRRAIGITLHALNSCSMLSWLSSSISTTGSSRGTRWWSLRSNGRGPYCPRVEVVRISRARAQPRTAQMPNPPTHSRANSRASQP